MVGQALNRPAAVRLGCLAIPMLRPLDDLSNPLQFRQARASALTAGGHHRVYRHGQLAHGQILFPPRVQAGV